jgi:hypothetical protein
MKMQHEAHCRKFDTQSLAEHFTEQYLFTSSAPEHASSFALLLSPSVRLPQAGSVLKDGLRVQ